MNHNLNESYLYVGLVLHCIAEADIINQTKPNLLPEKSCSGKEVPLQVQIFSIDLGVVAGGQDQLEILRFSEVFLVLAAQLSL